MAGDDNDTVSLLKSNIVYASKDLDVNDLEYDQECTYRTLPGKHLNIALSNHSILRYAFLMCLLSNSEFIYKTMIAIRCRSSIVT